MKLPLVSTFFAGLVFGLGLILAGMTDPAKVLAFLDLAGDWDPSLMFVMAGAIAVAAWPFVLARRRQTSWLGEPIRLPAARQLDRRLMSGSVLFGIGWGLSGLCPGPALVGAAAGQSDVAIFVAAMLVGMGLHAWWERRQV
jgi:uncharacterized membrane protein YedE/YeeE